MTGAGSYYEVLGVPVDAGLEEVHRAYVRRAQLLHPDRFVGAPEPARRQAEEDMKVLNEAWNTLKSPDARRRYDLDQGFATGDLEVFHSVEDFEAAFWPDEETEPEPPPSFFRRTGVRLIIVGLLVAGLAVPGLVICSGPDDRSGRWSPSARADLRSAAISAGFSASQADCFVDYITKRYAPSDSVDPSVVRQAADACR